MRYKEIKGLPTGPWSKRERKRLLAHFAREEGSGPRAQERARARRDEALRLDGFDRQALRAEMAWGR